MAPRLFNRKKQLTKSKANKSNIDIEKIIIIAFATLTILSSMISIFGSKTDSKYFALKPRDVAILITTILFGTAAGYITALSAKKNSEYKDKDKSK